MSIATFTVVAALLAFTPQSPPPSAAPNEGETSTATVEFRGGELVFRSPVLDASTPDELFELANGLRATLQPAPGVYLYPTPEHTLVTLGWTNPELHEARTAFEKFMRFTQMDREFENEKLARRTVTMDFKGGTLGDYIAALVQHFSLSAPIFEPPELRELSMRPVQLNRLDLQSAFRLPGNLSLTDAFDQRVRVQATWVGPAAAPALQRQTDQSNTMDDYRNSVCIISRVLDTKAAAATELRRAVFNLKAAKSDLATDELEVIMDAIDVAIDLDGTSSTFKAKYHAPSGLLIVRGTKDELNVAAQVLRAKLPSVQYELPVFEPTNPPVLKDVPLVGQPGMPSAKP